MKFLQFAGGGKKLHKIPSTLHPFHNMPHPFDSTPHPFGSQLCPVSPSLFSDNPYGPPSPEPTVRKGFSLTRNRMYSIDMGEFAMARARSKPSSL